MSELQIEKDAEWNPYENHEALIERLQAENAELQMFKQMWNDFVSLQHGDAQLLCKDAERYRWLLPRLVAWQNKDFENAFLHHTHETIEEAIDAAMKGGE